MSAWDMRFLGRGGGGADPAVLAAMPLEEFRRTVLLKLDAPDGLRYEIQPNEDAFRQGDAVPMTFRIENTSGKPIKLKYRPSVEVVDCSSMTTARGALVFPRGEDVGAERYPNVAKLVHPFAEREVYLAPGETFSMEVNLRDRYDLPPARYTISSRIDVSDSEPAYWHGHALADTKRFEITPSVPAQADAPAHPDTTNPTRK